MCNFEKIDIHKDLTHLEELVFSLSSDVLSCKISEECWILWNKKGKLEELIIKDLFNPELNECIYCINIAITRRKAILYALNSLYGHSLINLAQAFRIASIDIMMEEIIQPIDMKIIELSGEREYFYGNGYFSDFAGKAGNFNYAYVNEHDEVLYYWLKARNDGILKDNNILLHFDAHSDMVRIDENDINILNKIKSPDEFRNYIASSYSPMSPNIITPVHLASFIHYGVKSSLVREIFWCYPSPDYGRYRFPSNLELSHLFDIDGGYDFHLENGHVVCFWEGVKVHILRISELPVFQEEVLLDIDIDFFINYNSIDRKNGTRGYRIRDKKELAAWRELLDLPLKFGDSVPWIRPDEFSEYLKIKNVQTPIATIALSPFFTPWRFHILKDLIIKELTIK